MIAWSSSLIEDQDQPEGEGAAPTDAHKQAVADFAAERAEYQRQIKMYKSNLCKSERPIMIPESYSGTDFEKEFQDHG